MNRWYLRVLFDVYSGWTTWMRTRGALYLYIILGYGLGVARIGVRHRLSKDHCTQSKSRLFNHHIPYASQTDYGQCLPLVNPSNTFCYLASLYKHILSNHNRSHIKTHPPAKNARLPPFSYLPSKLAILPPNLQTPVILSTKEQISI